ncbi:uncharacterized protein LOC119211222 isoform X2 [Pungitius pungitius]|uniref:uncharacterized protein LOC119211222 isoform X2 n=1 Tax=Pungitius pungitius TaxID=134920 RepID=UPI002E0F94E6
MRMVVYFTLMLTAGRCSDQMIETRTVAVGSDVKLSCARESSGSVFWIRLVPGNVPEYLMKSNSFKNNGHITATQQPGTLDLHIDKASLRDAAVYYCFKTFQKGLTFLKATDLRVGEPDSSAVAPSDPVRPGDAVTEEKCPVPRDSEVKTCPGEHRVCCARATPHQYEPPFNGNSVEEHEGNAEEPPTEERVYSFFIKVGSSDDGYQYCAVKACEERFTRNETQQGTEDNLQKDIIAPLLCAALATSLIVIAILSYSIKKLKKELCGVCNAAVFLKSKVETAPGHRHSQQTEEDLLVYSAPTFYGRRPKMGGSMNSTTEEGESIYADVRVQGSDQQSNIGSAVQYRINSLTADQQSDIESTVQPQINSPTLDPQSNIKSRVTQKEFYITVVDTSRFKHTSSCS